MSGYSELEEEERLMFISLYLKVTDIGEEKAEEGEC